jgi:hypothetical protein
MGHLNLPWRPKATHGTYSKSSTSAAVPGRHRSPPSMPQDEMDDIDDDNVLSAKASNTAAGALCFKTRFRSSGGLVDFGIWVHKRWPEQREALFTPEALEEFSKIAKSQKDLKQRILSKMENEKTNISNPKFLFNSLDFFNNGSNNNAFRMFMEDTKLTRSGVPRAKSHYLQLSGGLHDFFNMYHPEKLRPELENLLNQYRTATAKSNTRARAKGEMEDHAKEPCPEPLLRGVAAFKINPQARHAKPSVWLAFVEQVGPKK